MDITLKPCSLSGEINDIIASKSLAHRAFICAALADGVTEIECNSSSKDIEATVGVIRSLGAEVTKNGKIYTVTPIKCISEEMIRLDFGESGSTMRFILPVLGALGVKAEMITHGRLTSRPLSPLYEQLVMSGMRLSAQGVCPMYCEGRLTLTEYTIDGGVSSQFISGLLFALSIMGGGSVNVTSRLESASYIRLTINMLENFGIDVIKEQNTFTVLPGKIESPGKMRIEGDWSNAAFWLAAGALSEKGITVFPMEPESAQGDRAITDILKKFGADVSVTRDKITVKKKKLTACTVDAADIPDLVPVISVVAAASRGSTIIENTARLRFKESDRVAAVCEMLEALGVKTEAYENRMVIHGGCLTGGTVNSYNDHRIAMSAAVASSVCEGEVTVLNAGAVSKSYPDFFKVMSTIGGKTQEYQGE